MKSNYNKGKLSKKEKEFIDKLVYNKLMESSFFAFVQNLDDSPEKRIFDDNSFLDLFEDSKR